MSLAMSLLENPEETEIDRLLLELGIELPVIENISSQDLLTGINDGYPSIADSNENLLDEDQTDNFLIVLRGAAEKTPS